MTEAWLKHDWNLRAHNVLHASTSRCQWALCAQNKSSQGNHTFPHQLIISRCSRQVVLLNLNKGRAIRIARGGVELSKVAFTLWIWIFRFVDIQQYPLTNILHLNVLTLFDRSISKSGSIGGARGCHAKSISLQNTSKDCGTLMFFFTRTPFVAQCFLEVQTQVSSSELVTLFHVLTRI